MSTQPSRPRQGRQQSLPWVHGLATVTPILGCANGLTVPSVALACGLDDPQASNALGAPDLADLGLARWAEVLAQPLPPASAIAAPGVPPEHVRLLQWVHLLFGALADAHPALAPSVAGAPTLRRPHPGASAQTAHAVVLWPTPLAAGTQPSVGLGLATMARAGIGLSGARGNAGHHHSPRTVGQSVVRLATGLAGRRQPQSAAGGRPCVGSPRAVARPRNSAARSGRRAHWFRSTLTDATSSMGVTLARDKVRTTRLLRQAGVPVPRHIKVASQAAAQAAATTLGYPVVVKPADQDRGDGARANLQTADQVITAYRHANQYSQRVLVEQYIPGREYRLTVVQGALIWAHERIPATVLGDGAHPLQQLVALENARRRIALRRNPNGPKPIVVDDDCIAYLQETGWSLSTIPPAGLVVRLQRVPAATTGGDGRGYFDAIHPDNRQLAERAARLLRLDMAGVDLIMPDITRSWRAVGGAVTEVNAIPQISTQTNPVLMQRVLQRLMPHRGRVPLLYALGSMDASAWVTQLVERLQAQGWHVGLSTSDGLWSGPEVIRLGRRASESADVRALQLDRDLDAMVVCGTASEWLSAGLPFDAIDVLVVTEHRPRELALLAPYTRGPRFVFEQAVAPPQATVSADHPPGWKKLSVQEQATGSWVADACQAMSAVQQQYATPRAPV